MIRTTEPVIEMTAAELAEAIEKAAKAAVAEVMKSLVQANTRHPKGDGGKGHALAWVRAERYIEMTGDPMSAVHDRILTGQWAAGKHYKRTGPRTLWVNLEQADSWIERHPHVEAALPPVSKRISKSIVERS